MRHDDHQWRAELAQERVVRPSSVRPQSEVQLAHARAQLHAVRWKRRWARLRRFLGIG